MLGQVIVDGIDAVPVLLAQCAVVGSCSGELCKESGMEEKLLPVRFRAGVEGDALVLGPEGFEQIHQLLHLAMVFLFGQVYADIAPPVMEDLEEREVGDQFSSAWAVKLGVEFSSDLAVNRVGSEEGLGRCIEAERIEAWGHGIADPAAVGGARCDVAQRGAPAGSGG